MFGNFKLQNTNHCCIEMKLSENFIKLVHFNFSDDTNQPEEIDYDMIEPTANEENYISVTTAAMILLATSLGVIVIMSMVICCVASSYKKKLQYRIMLSRGVK